MEEICGAKEYAECYLEAKADGMTDRAENYHSMAEDELRHAMIIHKIATEEIEKLNRVYTPSVEMQEKWDKTHREYTEKTSWVKAMLNM